MNTITILVCTSDNLGKNKIRFWYAVSNSLISVLKCQKEFAFNPLGNKKPMKGFKNVSGMETFYFRNKMALVVCGS